MQRKLGYKIFLAFLLTAFGGVALMVGTLQFYMSRHFADYVNRSILDRLDGLVTELALEYKSRDGWQAIRMQPGRWQAILGAGLDARRFPAAPAKGAEGPPESGRTVHLRRLARGLTLFDREKRPIAGRPAAGPADYTLREITVSGRTVGWLGLHKKEHLKSPLDARFLKEQALVFYQVGLGILILVAMVSYFLSRHLLAPIRQLTRGTRALREFRFDTRIDVRTQDELGELASDFNRMADTLRKYEHMRRQWISDISHELRTPLAVLKGEIEALQDGVRNPKPEAFDSLQSEVTRLSRLVEDLYLLSLADSRALLHKREPVEPLAILAKMAALYRPRLARKGIRLELDLADSRPVAAGDGDRLAQLFTNLLENTLRYTDAPGGLKIFGRPVDGRLVIAFEDSAPGVPAEALPRLFDRLFRVDRSRSRALGGSGLGLAICKEIVEAHGGAIRAETAVAGGLVIQIELPVSAAEKEPEKG